MQVFRSKEAQVRASFLIAKSSLLLYFACMHNRFLRRVVVVAAYVMGVYLILRALVEPFLINYSQPQTYMHDWGGPTYVGVLAVHMVPGIVSLGLIIAHVRKTRRSRTHGKH